jgi:hypothetical protein
MKTEFEKKLKDLGFTFQCNTDGLYILSQNNDPNSIVNAQLICSEPVDESKLGSRNGNVIQSIGHFKLRLPTEVKEQYFLILAFQNTNNHCVEYVIIPSRELKRRLFESNRTSNDNQEIVFWLMPDRFLYDCTNVGIEWEWYYMSEGVNGRMADATEWDYTEYLNYWNRLKMV